MAKSYSAEIANEISRFLENETGACPFDAERGYFHFGTKISASMKNVRFHVCVDDNEYWVYAVFPISADAGNAAQMTKMAEFISRANYGMHNGNFELDFKDGEIRYKSYVNCEGILPTQEMISASICCPATMLSVYSDGMIRALFTDMTAAEAVKRCESRAHMASERVFRQAPDVSYAQAAAQLVDQLEQLLQEEDADDMDDEDISAAG